MFITLSVEPFFWPIIAGIGGILAGAFSALAIAYHSWPLYAVPFLIFSVVAWLKTRGRDDAPKEYDSKCFAGSSEALDWLLRVVKREHDR